MRQINLMLAAGLLSLGCEKLRPLLDSITDGYPDHPGHGDPEPPEPPCGFTVTIDDLYSAVHADLQTLDAPDRVFVRYVSLANRSNAGVCASRLDADRRAIDKLLNSLSMEAEIKAAIPIDSEELIYRFDLRDYDWDRPIGVSALVFADGWEAVIGLSPLAFEYTGDDADGAKALSGTTVPVLAFDAFVKGLNDSDVYYALAGVPGDRDSLFAALDVDIEADMDAGTALRAGITESRLSREDRVVERFPLDDRAVGLWRVQDFSADSGEAIFSDPLGAEGDGSFVLYPLPNGLLAFGIFDADGIRAPDTELVLDAFQGDFRVRAPMSCFNCHAQGPLAFEDAVRPFVQSNPDQFDLETVSVVLSIFPTASQASEIVQADVSAFQAALLQVGISDPDTAEPISSALFEFESAMLPIEMAGDFLVSPAEFEAKLSALPRPLSRQSIERVRFTELYPQSLCVVHADTANQPVDCQ